MVPLIKLEAYRMKIFCEGYEEENQEQKFRVHKVGKVFLKMKNDGIYRKEEKTFQFYFGR